MPERSLRAENQLPITVKGEDFFIPSSLELLQKADFTHSVSQSVNINIPPSLPIEFMPKFMKQRGREKAEQEPP